MLECRFDNVSCASASPRRAARPRQMIRHGHWSSTAAASTSQLPGRENDVIASRLDHRANQVIPRLATELVAQVPAWLQADHDQLTAKVLRKPERAEIAAPVQEQLICRALLK
jgi:small subunit ribosomal protein S4